MIRTLAGTALVLGVILAVLVAGAGLGAVFGINMT